MGGMGSTTKGGGSDLGGASNAMRAKGVDGGAGARGLSNEFEANNPQIMPVYNSPAQLQAAKAKRQSIMARSGRTSTNLTGNPGTKSFLNSFLGSVS